MTLVSDLEKRMEGAIASLNHDLKGLRTGRASAALLENITVEVYGSRMHLQQVANINVPEPRMLTVQVWDNGNVQAVEKAIINANLGLNPSTEGALIRLPIPPLTEDRRKELVKVAGQFAEKARIAIRNIRRDGMDHAKKSEKDGEISEDELHNLSDDIQKLTEKYIKKIDELTSAKEKDIMSV